jgi:hypothetical protein
MAGCIMASGAVPLSLAAISFNARFCQPCVEASSPLNGVLAM